VAEKVSFPLSLSFSLSGVFSASECEWVAVTTSEAEKEGKYQGPWSTKELHEIN